MKFTKKLVHGKLIKRYKRFLADITLDDGLEITAHCTNSGSMKSCLEKDAEVYLTHHNNPKRKTQYTWEMIKIGDAWVGINTNHPNQLVYEAVMNDDIEKLKGYPVVKKEVKWGDSRFDIYAENKKEKCFIEVKNVTLKEGRYAKFPDAVTIRGQKHLKTLLEIKKAGMRAVMVYIIQRIDVEVFVPAKEIDKNYAEILKTASEEGVEIIPLMAKVSPEGIELFKEMPYEL